MLWSELAAMAAGGAAVGTPLWAWTRYPITVVHETGHAVVARMCGARDVRVSLHVGSGGLTDWEAEEGEGPLAMWAGFPAPGLLGLGALAGLHYGSSAWVLWGTLGLLAGVLLMVRNFFGIVLVGLCGLPVYGALRYLPDGLQYVAVLALAWTLLLGAVRSAYQDAAEEGSDCDLLYEATGYGRNGWYLGFLATAVATVGAVAYLTTIWW